MNRLSEQAKVKHVNQKRLNVPHVCNHKGTDLLLNYCVSLHVIINRRWCEMFF